MSKCSLIKKCCIQIYFLLFLAWIMSTYLFRKRIYLRIFPSYKDCHLGIYATAPNVITQNAEKLLNFVLLQQAFILFLRLFIYFTWYIMIVIIKNTTRDVLCMAMSSAYSYHQIIFPNLPFCGTLMLKLFFTYINKITQTDIYSLSRFE